uniref:helix-turn-helix domain-containing protein n=1 Tax=Methylobacterium nigriterrae TaxID=3127512 RepID=UPI0030137D3F
FCELLLRLQLVGCADGNSFDLPLTQGELGDVLGLTNVHVNRVLQDLRKRNLIVLRGGDGWRSSISRRSSSRVASTRTTGT